MGAVGAMVLAGDAPPPELGAGAQERDDQGTMRITAMVVFILIGSRVFSLVFQGVDGGIWIEHMLKGCRGASSAS